jgi:hypothetical protein
MTIIDGKGNALTAHPRDALWNMWTQWAKTLGQALTVLRVFLTHWK